MIELATSSPAIRILLLIVVFALVAGLIMLIVSSFDARRRASKQIARLNTVAAGAPENRLVRDIEDNRWDRIADAIERTGIDLTDKSNLKLEKQLKQAGYRSSSAPRIYTLVRMAMIFILPGLYLLSVYFSPDKPEMLRMYVISAILAALGLYLPTLYIRGKADRRKAEIVNGFPDALDLILVSVEAGLGLESALDRVGREMVRSHRLISELLIECTLMMRAGAPRDLALRQLAESSAVDEIRSFSTLLIQSDKLGTSIASTLRVYAAEMREARRMRAEERAHRIPVMISIPLVACMLPVMVGVLALPAIIGFVRELGPALAGG